MNGWMKHQAISHQPSSYQVNVGNKNNIPNTNTNTTTTTATTTFSKDGTAVKNKSKQDASTILH